tara:strand:+ start:359 stop:613 length:255 start_codon:yes stop_codon:yes gene_type:complete
MSNPKKTKKEIREAIEKRKAKRILHPDEKAIADVDEAIDEIMRNKEIEKNKQSKDEEIEITCCGVEITDEIRDNDLCPKCLEHL